METEADELEAEYEELAAEDVGDIDHIALEISQLREQKRRLENDLSKLQNVIQFNQEMLDGTSTDIATPLRGDGTEEAVRDKLLDEPSEVACWTCGTKVEEEKIEDILSRLRNLR